MTVPRSLPPVFVINLSSATDRREAMRQRLDPIGLDYSFLEAVDGRGFDLQALSSYDSRRRCRAFGRDLTPGEMGCVLSHRAACEKMVAENIPAAIVMEDDVMPEPDFTETIAALMETMVPWDIVRFLGSEKIYRRGFRKIAPLTGRFWLARLPTSHGGSYCYLLTQKAARTFLKHMQKNWMPVDMLQGRSWATGLETLVVHPAPIYPDEVGASTIGDARFDKTITLTGWERRLFPLTRFWFKLNETLGKKWVYWSSWFRDSRAGR